MTTRRGFSRFVAPRKLDFGNCSVVRAWLGDASADHFRRYFAGGYDEQATRSHAEEQMSPSVFALPVNAQSGPTAVAAFSKGRGRANNNGPPECEIQLHPENGTLSVDA